MHRRTAEHDATTWRIWAVALFALLIWIAFSKLTLRIDADDAMRLVQVRDLLAGQSWFDLTQHRLGPEGGTAMHGSRLVDAPIALLILLVDLFAERAAAERAVTVIWPGLLFAGTLGALAAICHRLGGIKAALYGTILAALLLAQSGPFAPGSLDNHNLQIMLLTLALAGFVYRRLHPGYASLSGIAVALALGVGLETLPQLAVVSIAFALIWAWRGDIERPAAFGFGGVLSGTLMLVYFGTVPAEARIGGVCDTLSRDLFLPVITGAVSLSLATFVFNGHSRVKRFAVLVGVAMITAAVTLILAPVCLGSPLGTLGPATNTASLRDLSHDRLGFVAGGMVGLLIAIWFILRDVRWESWSLLAATIFASLALSTVQARGFPVLAALSILPTAVLASRLSAPEAKPDRAWSTVVMVCVVLLSVPAATSALVSGGLAVFPSTRAAPAALDTSAMTEMRCTSAKDLTALATLPPGVISAPPSLGAYILLHTPHRTLASLYHRNRAGMLAQRNVSDAAPEDAKALLAKHGVDYIATCGGDRQFAGEASGLSAHLSMTPPAFLERIETRGPLTIHRVVR